jgi:predicted hydrocarbon binding protein
MAKTDNSHSLRLFSSIQKYSDEKTAERITNKIPLSKSADINKKFAWAESICADLQKEFNEYTIKLIRMDCACGPEMGKINNLHKIYQSSDNIDDFIEKANKLKQGFTIKHENCNLYLIYPQCYCSCVKRIEKPISKVWCYCTLGYTKRMFERILERVVEVELLESVKTGGSRCLIKVTF